MAAGMAGTKLFNTAVEPQLVDVQAVYGTPPSRLAKLRTVAAQATGHWRKGSSTTTLLELCNPVGDPVAVLCREAVVLWFRLWGSRPDLHARLDQ